MRLYQTSLFEILLASAAAFVPYGPFVQAETLTTDHRQASQHASSPEVSLHAEHARMPHRFPLGMQQVFVVIERNPLTNEIVGTPGRFSSRLEATRYRESLRNGAWVVWRYVGTNEPMRSIRFNNRIDAETFVRTGGPARRGLLGKVLLSNETRVLSARVSLETENVR